MGGDVATMSGNQVSGDSGVPLGEVEPMADYTLEQTGERHFILLRNGQQVITFGGDREDAEQGLREYRDQEATALEALASGDPKALCRLGWHAALMPAPVAKHLGAISSYFTFAARIGLAGGTLIYRVAQGPFLYESRTVKTLGNITPWVCGVCERPIGPMPPHIGANPTG